MKRPVTQIVQRTHDRAPWLPASLVRAAVTLRNVVSETASGFAADRGLDLAGSLAFTTLLAAVPLLATFSLLLATFFRENVAEVFDLVNSILPYHAARVTENLREFVAESTAISGIGLLVLLVSSVRLIFIIEGVFNAVWGAPRRQRWLQRVAIYTFVLFALAMLVGAIGLGVRVLRRFPAGASIVSSPAAELLVPIVVVFVALGLLYKFLPNAYVRWAPAVIAAAAVSLLLELIRRLFGIYVGALSRMNLITGSLTLVLFSLLSVFLVWVLILIGVELTHVLQSRTGTRRRGEGPRAGRTENAVRMLLALAGGGIHTFRDLYHQQEAHSVEAEKVLDCLRQNRLIDGDDTRGYTLARPAEEITVAEVVEAISPNLYALTPRENDPVGEALEPLFLRLDAERRALLSATIEELRKKEK